MKRDRHSSETKVVVVRGTLVYSIDGADSKPLGAGSYIALEAMTLHAARCTGDEECEIFLEQPGPMDIKPAR